MIRSLIFIIISLLTTACTGANGNFDITKPVSLDMRAPDGPPEYRKGWTDGCESALAATNDKVMVFFGAQKYTLDPQLRSNRLYFTAWRYAYEHCGYSMRAMHAYKYM